MSGAAYLTLPWTTVLLFEAEEIAGPPKETALLVALCAVGALLTCTRPPRLFCTMVLLFVASDSAAPPKETALLVALCAVGALLSCLVLPP